MDLKLLFVEDERDFAEIVGNTLEQLVGGYEVRMAADGEEGLRLWREFKPDVIVTDVLMPCMDGVDMVKRIRQEDPHTVIIFTSRLTSPDDVGRGYDCGGDDYIKKPFAPKELHCFIRNYLARIGWKPAILRAEKLRAGFFSLDSGKNTLTDERTGETKLLGEYAATVLRILMEHPDRAVSREAIIGELWGNEWSDSNLNDLVYRLRKMLKSDPGLDIQRLRGVGYKLVTGKEDTR